MMSTPEPHDSRHLLDREAPEEYRHEWTARIASTQEFVVPGTVSAVIFRLGEEWLALPTIVFQEIVEEYVVRSVPHRRGGGLLGLVNVRGELVLCVSLAQVTGQQAGNPESEQPLLVMHKHGKRLAFPVDEIAGIHRYNPRDLVDVPSTLEHASNSLTINVLRWQGKTVGILDDEALLTTVNRSVA